MLLIFGHVSNQLHFVSRTSLQNTTDLHAKLKALHMQPVKLESSGSVDIQDYFYMLRLFSLNTVLHSVPPNSATISSILVIVPVIKPRIPNRIMKKFFHSRQ